MPTETEGNADALAMHLQRMSVSVEQVSARIARIATVLQVDLQNEGEFARVMNHKDGSDGSPAVPVRALPAAGPDRRRRNLHDELRGLLVLRYRIARCYVDRVGIHATRHILVHAQDQLEREGFKPGASGADLHRVFDGF